MAPPPSTVSFTVRRPTPPTSSGTESERSFKIPSIPRHLSTRSRTSSPLAGSPRTFSSRDDSDDDGQTGIVFANGPGDDGQGHHTESSDDDHWVSKRPGAQRSHRHKTKTPDAQAPLIIPSKPNPDWREAARKRRAGCARVQPLGSQRAAPAFVPDSALATTGADGSVGGLGTRDTINSGPQLSGLQINKKVRLDAEAERDGAATVGVSAEDTTTEALEETEDQRALRAILAGQGEPVPVVDVIPVPPLSETDALRQDVEDLPDVATANDYERVPISAFGAAMLRGMGWTEGAVGAKSDKRRKNGLTELYLPQARPALLGIGAKERETEDDGSTKKKAKGLDMRYVPVARRESGRGEDGSSRSGTASRRASRSPPRREERAADREDRERRRDRDERRIKEYTDRAHERKDRRSGDRDVDRDRTRDRGRGDSYRDRERGYDGRDRTRERDRRDRQDDR